MELKKQILELNELNAADFITYIGKINLQEKHELINNPYLTQLAKENFKILLFNLNDDQFKELLSSEAIFSKILDLSERESILSILERNKFNFFKLMFENKYSLNYIQYFIDYLNKLDKDKFKKISSLIDLEKILGDYFSVNSPDKLYSFLNAKFESELDENFDYIFNQIIEKAKNNKLNIYHLLKINNYKELILYSKFNILIDIDNNFDDIVLPNGLVFPYEEVFKLKESKINKIIDGLKNKGEAKDSELLEVALKLYYIFGYDYSKKIIEDKFTNMTESAIIKIAEFNYKDVRREYRAKNQKKFYYYGMVQEVLNSLINGSNEIFEYLVYDDTDDVQSIKKEFSSLLNKYNNEIELKSSVKELLKEKIYEREQQYKKIYYKRIKEKYNLDNKNKLDTHDLLLLLKNVDLIKVINTYDENTLNELRKFLLGNTKNNNDCLLRIIINQEALGLDDNVFQLINNFKLIKSIADKSKLSLNSILDIIDILKINLYNLKPNEQDIYLSTLTKIINSTEYCNDIDNKNIVKEICNLHIQRKEKVYASIPTVKGICGEYTYEVAPFDSEYLLSSGCDSKNCFKISGLGEDFFRYCLTSNQAVVIYIRGKGKTYISPAIRSGNMINCNNLDPIIELGEEKNVIDTLKTCLNDIINKSNINENPEENIQLATITNWHLERILANQRYKTIEIEKSLPLDIDCYTDYNKKNIINYVLAKKENFKKIKYYLSEDKFYQERTPNYEFNINNEYDKERLSLIVNSICYSSIEYRNLTTKEKNKRRREFKKLDVSKFKYIIGNKDWYVAIDDSLNVLANILPYDERAKKDYFAALANISTILEQLMEESEYDRQDLRKNR